MIQQTGNQPELNSRPVWPGTQPDIDFEFDGQKLVRWKSGAMELAQTAADSSIRLIGVDAKPGKLLSQVGDQSATPARLGMMRWVEQQADIGATLTPAQDRCEAMTRQMEALTRLRHPIDIALPVRAMKTLQQSRSVLVRKAIGELAKTMAMIGRTIEVDEQTRHAAQHWLVVQ